LNEFVNELNRVISMAPDPQIDDRAVRVAVQLLARVMEHDTPTPSVVPRVNGGLQLEWHLRGTDLEVSIDPDGGRSFWCEHAPSGREWVDDSGAKLWLLRKELSALADD